MAAESNHRRVQPFLTALATPRSGDSVIPGHYSPERHVWVIETSHGERPLVEMRPGLGGTSTGTSVKAEEDDSDIDFAALAATSTFTKVTAEGDDTDITAAALLEVNTKTYAQVESEDNPVTIDAFMPANDGPSVAHRIR